LRTLFLHLEVYIAIKYFIALYGHSGLDSVVHVAGVFALKTLRELTLEEFNFPLKVDVSGSFLMAKFSLPHLEKTKGNMVFITSMASKK